MSDAPAVLIVADDLSGAADSAAALAPRASTAVALRAAAEWPPADVVSVDTDSRYLPAPDAAAACAAVARRAAPHSLVYKKIDSTLRGHIGPETASILSVLAAGGERGPGPGRFLAVLAPAFPATGRTVLDGQVHVDGERLDLRHPQRQPLCAQLRSAGLEVARLSLSELRGDRPETSLRAMAGHVDAVVVDALTDEDLARTVRACTGLRVLLAGSGGLAHHLPLPGTAAAADTADEANTADAANAAGVVNEVDGAGPGRDEAPALFCVGSRSDTAHAQLRALLEGTAALPVPVPPDARKTGTAARRVSAALEDGRDVVVFPDPETPVQPHRAGEIAAALASVTSAGLGAAGTLVATGGETARAVLRDAGVDTLHVLGEPEPGVVRMSAPGGLRVITKAGSFGDDGTLLRTAPSLRTDGAVTSGGSP